MYGGGEQTVSEPYGKYLILGATADPNISTAMDDDEHLCKLVLYKEIQNSRVRIWDVLILIPNLLFFLFIAVRFNRARLKLRATSSPIFLAFYGLVMCNVVISVIRCLVSMSVNASGSIGGMTDKVLWVTVRFFLLSTEMSVVIFGLAFGHLDSRSSIKRVLLATSFIALAYTITQGTLELILPDDTFHIPSRDFYVFGHGGMMFWFCSSLVFTLIYLFILILPWTRLRDRLNLPTKKSFYIYAGTLATLNLIQSIGAGLLNYTQNPAGLCVVDLTVGIYLTLFTPLVYHTFLSEFFGVSQPSIMFSLYKAQVDDAMEEDTVSLPHQQSFSSLKTDSDYIYQVHSPSIHMPLYEPLTAKPSISKYSLHPSTSRYSSQATLYNISPNAKMIRQRNATTLKSTPDLIDRNNLTGELGGINSQYSSPDLSYNNHSIINHDDNNYNKFRESESASNLVLSPSTASNFIYSPKDNDSNVNLFSDSYKLNSQIIGNLSSSSSSSTTTTTTATSTATTTTTTAFNNVLKTKSRNNTNDNDLNVSKSPSTSDLPPLENSLQNILDSKTTSNAKSTRSVKSLDLELDSSRFKLRKYDKKQLDSNVDNQSGGLGDYLQSLKSPQHDNPVIIQYENHFQAPK